MDRHIRTLRKFGRFGTVDTTKQGSEQTEVQNVLPRFEHQTAGHASAQPRSYEAASAQHRIPEAAQATIAWLSGDAEKKRAQRLLV